MKTTGIININKSLSIGNRIMEIFNDNSLPEFYMSLLIVTKFLEHHAGIDIANRTEFDEFIESAVYDFEHFN